MKGAIDKGLKATASLWPPIVLAFGWVHRAAHVLGLEGNSGTDNPQDLFLQANLPAIFSWGIAYKGIEKWLLSLDLRYMDYAGTSLFGLSIADGGLNWRSIFIAAMGAQYQITERVALRAGYLYNQNPVRNADTLFNVQAPAITQHAISAGFTYKISDSFSTSLAYTIGLPNSIQGDTFQSRDTGTKIDSYYQSLTFGLNFAFGSQSQTGTTRYDVVEVPAGSTTTPLPLTPPTPMPQR